MHPNQPNGNGFAAHRAALMEFNHEGIVRMRSICVEATPQLLLRNVSSFILFGAELLLNAYWEWIDDEILGLLLNLDSAAPLVTENHGHGDILPFLQKAIDVHEQTLMDGPQDATILGTWYDQLQFLNDVWLCDTNPPGNYIRVALEADLPAFTKQLFEHEAQRFDPRLILVDSYAERFEAVGFSRKLDEQSAAQLGQLLVLSQAKVWQWQEKAMYAAFCRWADEFNEVNQ